MTSLPTTPRRNQDGGINPPYTQNTPTGTTRTVDPSTLPWSPTLPPAVAFHRDLTPGEVQVCLALEEYARRKAFCWMPNEALAGLCTCDPRTIRRAIATLAGENKRRRIDPPLIRRGYDPGKRGRWGEVLILMWKPGAREALAEFTTLTVRDPDPPLVTGMISCCAPTSTTPAVRVLNPDLDGGGEDPDPVCITGVHNPATARDPDTGEGRTPASGGEDTSVREGRTPVSTEVSALEGTEEKNVTLRDGNVSSFDSQRGEQTEDDDLPAIDDPAETGSESVPGTRQATLATRPARTIIETVEALPGDRGAVQPLALWIADDLRDQASLRFYLKVCGKVAREEDPVERLLYSYRFAMNAAKSGRADRPGALFVQAWNGWQPRLTEREARERDRLACVEAEQRRAKEQAAREAEQADEWRSLTTVDLLAALDDFGFAILPQPDGKSGTWRRVDWTSGTSPTIPPALVEVLRERRAETITIIEDRWRSLSPADLVKEVWRIGFNVRLTPGPCVVVASKIYGDTVELPPVLTEQLREHEAEVIAVLNESKARLREATARIAAPRSETIAQIDARLKADRRAQEAEQLKEQRSIQAVCQQNTHDREQGKLPPTAEATPEPMTPEQMAERKAEMLRQLAERKARREQAEREQADPPPTEGTGGDPAPDG